MKLALLYIFIMGLLFISLLAILKSGRKLVAPQDVNGEWYIYYNSVKALNNRCISFGIPQENPVINIEQSGVYITLTLNNPKKTIFTGKIEHENLNLIEAGHNDNNSSFILRAGLYQGKNDNDELRGILYNPSKKDCPEISFSAIRHNHRTKVD